jgi:hypothetical protein
VPTAEYEPKRKISLYFQFVKTFIILCREPGGHTESVPIWHILNKFLFYFNKFKKLFHFGPPCQAPSPEPGTAALVLFFVHDSRKLPKSLDFPPILA